MTTRKRRCTYLPLRGWGCSKKRSRKPSLPTSGKNPYKNASKFVFFLFNVMCSIYNVPGKESEKIFSSTFLKGTLKSYQENRKEYTRCWCQDSLKDSKKIWRIFSSYELNDTVSDISWETWYFQWLSINYVLGKFQHAEHLGNDEVRINTIHKR